VLRTASQRTLHNLSLPTGSPKEPKVSRQSRYLHCQPFDVCQLGPERNFTLTIVVPRKLLLPVGQQPSVIIYIWSSDRDDESNPRQALISRMALVTKSHDAYGDRGDTATSRVHNL